VKLGETNKITEPGLFPEFRQLTGKRFYEAALAVVDRSNGKLLALGDAETIERDIEMPIDGFRGQSEHAAAASGKRLYPGQWLSQPVQREQSRGNTRQGSFRRVRKRLRPRLGSQQLSGHLDYPEKQKRRALWSAPPLSPSGWLGPEFCRTALRLISGCLSGSDIPDNGTSFTARRVTGCCPARVISNRRPKLPSPGPEVVPAQDTSRSLIAAVR
jgi:hypothetical protein